jgi:hypothetical protein
MQHSPTAFLSRWNFTTHYKCVVQRTFFSHWREPLGITSYHRSQVEMNSMIWNEITWHSQYVLKGLTLATQCTKQHISYMQCLSKDYRTSCCSSCSTCRVDHTLNILSTKSKTYKIRQKTGYFLYWPIIFKLVSIVSDLFTVFITILENL